MLLYILIWPNNHKKNEKKIKALPVNLSMITRQANDFIKYMHKFKNKKNIYI